MPLMRLMFAGWRPGYRPLPRVPSGRSELMHPLSHAMQEASKDARQARIAVEFSPSRLCTRPSNICACRHAARGIAASAGSVLRRTLTVVAALTVTDRFNGSRAAGAVRVFQLSCRAFGPCLSLEGMSRVARTYCNASHYGREFQAPARPSPMKLAAVAERIELMPVIV